MNTKPERPLRSSERPLTFEEALAYLRKRGVEISEEEFLQVLERGEIPFFLVQ